MNKYLFTSERLGFRCWQAQDIEGFYQICSDPNVMRYFPATLTIEEVSTFTDRMNEAYDDKGYCYFAVDYLEKDELIGFICLKHQSYHSEFNPSVDIGWRISKKYQGKGLATEGALECLKIGFEEFNLEKIVAVAPKANQASINVMQKIGMSFEYFFVHPLMKPDSELQPCVLYSINRSTKST